MMVPGITIHAIATSLDTTTGITGIGITTTGIMRIGIITITTTGKMLAGMATTTIIGTIAIVRSPDGTGILVTVADQS